MKYKIEIGFNCPMCHKKDAKPRKLLYYIFDEIDWPREPSAEELSAELRKVNPDVGTHYCGNGRYIPYIAVTFRLFGKGAGSPPYLKYVP